MIGIGKDMQESPIMINKDLEIIEFKRVLLSEKSFSESWIQEIINNKPKLLPLKEISPFFYPPISLGREIEIKDGFIDNLFVNPEGYITIVETKLWKNADARRIVIGQIIEYAKELNKLTFDELDKKVRKKNVDQLGILELINASYPIDEMVKSSIIDTINRNLRIGRFLLLIVGDGIRENVEEMVKFLNQTPSLNFSFALIELKVFKNKDDSMLIIPNTLVKTVEIERAIVRIEGSDLSKVSVELPSESVIVKDKFIKQSKLNYDDFVQLLSNNVPQKELEFVKQLMNEFDNESFMCRIGKASVIICYRNVFLYKPIPIFSISNSSGVVQITSWMTDKLKDTDISESIGHDFLNKTVELLKIVIKPNSIGVHDKYTTLENLNNNYQNFKSLIYEFKDNIEKDIESRNDD